MKKIHKCLFIMLGTVLLSISVLAEVDCNQEKYSTYENAYKENMSDDSFWKAHIPILKDDELLSLKEEFWVALVTKEEIIQHDDKVNMHDFLVSNSRVQNSKISVFNISNLTFLNEFGSLEKIEVIIKCGKTKAEALKKADYSDSDYLFFLDQWGSSDKYNALTNTSYGLELVKTVPNSKLLLKKANKILEKLIRERVLEQGLIPFINK